jgi:DHA2 family methylenomycin A resistance protein-like MFS transporter
VQLDVSVVNVAIKAIGTGLGGSITGLQWVVSAYTLSFASLILSAGALADRVGAKRVFGGGFLVFTIASALCAAAPDLATLIAARAVQGIGAAALVPASLTLLNYAYPRPVDRRRAVGIWAACASVALAVGPLVGRLLTASLGWRAIFLINVPLGALGLVLTARNVHETPRSPARGVDLGGQTLAVLALLSLTAAVIQGGRYGFTTPLVLAGLGFTLAAAVAFVAVEAHIPQPMLPLPLFRFLDFAACTAIGSLINVAFYGMIFVLSLYFQSVRGYSVLAAGAAFVPITVGVFVGNLLAQRLVAGLGVRRVLTAAAAVTAGSLAGLVVIGAGTSYAAVVAQLVTLGSGIGVIVPTMTSAQLGSVESDRAGLASGTLNTARQTGSVVGVALFGSLVSGGLVAGTRVAVLVSIGLMMVVLCLSAAVSGGRTA